MKYLKQFIINLLLFSLAWVTYSAYTSVSSWDPLTPTMWNNLLAKVDWIFTDWTGKVGIGNSSPTEKLDVTWNIKSSGTICWANWCLWQVWWAFTCTEEFDLIETWNSIITFNPSAAKKAELMAHWYICWNRMDDWVKISPLDWYNFATWYYNVWVWTTYKVCWRINYYSWSPDNYILSWMPWYFFWLRYVDWVNSTLHGRWAAWWWETYWSVWTSDRWTIWTCK